jgi:prepilin-type N-terminal cleavage/methylation domain-containing protein
MRMKILRFRFLGVSSGVPRPNPKSEGRKPKEIRNPKPETTEPLALRGADRPAVPWFAGFSPKKGLTPRLRLGFFGFRSSDFLRVSGFGFRISRALCSSVDAVENVRSMPHSREAFTLIEVVISVALMALIITSAYLCLHAAVSSQKMIEPRATVFQNARVAMALMTADLRCACPLSKDAPFLGMRRMLGTVEADNLDFATHNYTPRRPRQGDYCQVSFFLDKDRESGQFVLYRRRNPIIAFDSLSGGSREEIARGLVGLRFDYYDGVDWYETWGEVDRRNRAQNSRREHYNLEGMPQAVRITLWFDPNPKTKPTDATGTAAASTSTEEPATEPPLVFQTVARLNLATASQNASESGSDNSGQGAQPGPSGGSNQ